MKHSINDEQRRKLWKKRIANTACNMKNCKHALRAWPQRAYRHFLKSWDQSGVARRVPRGDGAAVPAAARGGEPPGTLPGDALQARWWILTSIERVAQLHRVQKSQVSNVR